MSKKLMLGVSIVAILCIAVAAVSFFDTEENNPVQNELTPVSVPGVASSTEEVAIEVPPQGEPEPPPPPPPPPVVPRAQDNTPPKTETALPVTNVVTQPEVDVVEESESTPKVTSNERTATPGERVKMKTAVEEFVDVLKTGSRNEVKVVMDYKNASAEDKAEFDSMSDEELESFREFMVGLMEEGFLAALDSPDMHDFTVTVESNGVLDVTVIEKETDMPWSGSLPFKDVGGKWVVSL